ASQRLTADDQRALEAAGETLHYKFGQIVVREGDPSDGVYLISEGAARVVRQAGNARETMLAMLGPGDIFGEMASGDVPRMATVRASGRLTAVRVSWEALDRLLEARPHLRGYLQGSAESRALATLIAEK